MSKLGRKNPLAWSQTQGGTLKLKEKGIKKAFGSGEKSSQKKDVSDSQKAGSLTTGRGGGEKLEREPLARKKKRGMRYSP